MGSMRASSFQLTVILAAFATVGLLAMGTGACGSGDGGSTSSSTGGSGGGGSGGDATGGSGGGSDTWPGCHTCLQTACKAEITACGTGCADLQGCLDTYCATLSATGSSDEGACQVYCQQQFAASKQPHIDLVNCAQGAMSTCMPPCAFAPYDFEQCIAHAAATTCKTQLAACDGEPKCVAFRTCVSTCTTAAGCEACGASADGKVGAAVDQAYWKCVAGECTVEAWLPQF
jgi:hypothetical protein